jgi:heme A synthase
MGVAVLVTQVAIGALTIASRLDPLVVTAHLALGTATFGFTLILAIVSLWPTAAASAE